MELKPHHWVRCALRQTIPFLHNADTKVNLKGVGAQEVLTRAAYFTVGLRLFTLLDG